MATGTHEYLPPIFFKVEKPNVKLGIGIDALPTAIKNSNIFTGNHLGKLANVNQMPVADPAFHDARFDALCYYFRDENKLERIQAYAKELLDEGKVDLAWQVLLAPDNKYNTPPNLTEIKNHS